MGLDHGMPLPSDEGANDIPTTGQVLPPTVCERTTYQCLKFEITGLRGLMRRPVH